MAYDSVLALLNAGIGWQDAHDLRRIAMTLHRWHELECGMEDNYKSYCIVRGRKEKIGFVYDDNGKPFYAIHMHSGGAPTYQATSDRETGARKRLKAIMARYPSYGYYIQGDPRGAALYILRPEDRIPSADIESYYNRGVVVCK